jgi:GYF domain 2
VVLEGWYLYDGVEQSGPLSIGELREQLTKHAQPDTLQVWRSGFADRKRVSDCPEIFAPPPLPSATLSEGVDRGIGVDRGDRSANFLLRYWRGELSLGVSYWVFGVLGGIAIAIVAGMVRLVANSQTGFDPYPIFLAGVFSVLLTCAATVWQLVGIWRSADHNVAARRLAGKRAPWARIAQIVMVLGVVRFVVDLARSAVPQLHELYQIAFENDPSIPAYSIRVMREGREAEIVGGIKYGLTRDFEKVLQASPDMRVVHLTSLGGRIREAEKLNELFRTRQLTTYVPIYCYSACTIAFAAGRERFLAQNAHLGFHGPAFPGLGKWELNTSIAEQKTFFRLADMKSDFIDKALATPSKDLWKPTMDELLQAHVITSVSDGTQFAASGFGDKLTKGYMADVLSSGLPTYRAMRERYPDEFDSIAETYLESVQAGKSNAESIAAARAKTIPLLVSLQPQADDGVVLELGNVLLDEYIALAAKSDALCYRFGSGKGPPLDPSSAFPKSLLDRESAVEERVVRTARSRDVADAKDLDLLWGKVRERLYAIGVTADDLRTFGKAEIGPEQQSQYCAVSIKLLRVVLALPPSEAAPLMRNMLARRKRQ